MPHHLEQCESRHFDILKVFRAVKTKSAMARGLALTLTPMASPQGIFAVPRGHT